MNKYKVLNIISKAIALPFKIVIMPITLIIGLIATDWENQADRDFFHKQIKLW